MVWPVTPQKIDEDGIPDFIKMELAGQITVLSKRNWDDRQYLWPIPTKRCLLMIILVRIEGINF